MGEKARRSGSSADDFARLAVDYDRWGLAAEAEAARALYRQAVVDDLREQALAVARRSLRSA